MPTLSFTPKSTLVSSQEVENTSAENRGAFVGFLVMILIKPPTASLPYKEEAGPFTISIRSTNEFGIPDNPYTVDKLLTMGIPSIKTKVYGPSSPLMWMSPVLQTPQLSCGRTPFTFCKAS